MIYNGYTKEQVAGITFSRKVKEGDVVRVQVLKGKGVELVDVQVIDTEDPASLKCKVPSGAELRTGRCSVLPLVKEKAVVRKPLRKKKQTRRRNDYSRKRGG